MCARQSDNAKAPRRRPTKTVAGGTGPISAETLAELARSQAAIIENADLGVAVYRLEDPNDAKSLRILSLNRVGERIMGVRAKDVVGKLVLEAFPAAEVAVLERDARIALGGASEHADEVRYAGDARLPEAYFSVHAVPLGNLTMAVVFHDVTERKRTEEALRRSESMLRSVLEHIPSGVTIRDALTGDLILANSRSREIMGKLVDVPGEFGRYQGLHPNGRAYQTEDWPVSRSMATGEVVDAEEIPCERSDGTRITLSMSSAPVRDSQGQVVIGVGVFSDITERKRAEEALQTTLQRFHTLVSSMHGSVLLVGEDRVEMANQAFCDYFGLKNAPADLVGLTAARMIQRIKNAYLDPDKQTSRIAEIVRRGQPVTGEEIAMRDGRVCLRDFVPISVDGRSHARLWYHTDITDHKRAEEALHESEERYRALLNSAPDAILVHRGGSLLYANPAALALYGAATFDELAAHDVTKLANPDHTAKLEERVRTLMAGRNVPLRETSIIRLDGREVPVEVISSPIEYDGGRAVQVMARDITDREEAHAQIESLARFPGENPNPVLRISRYGVLMYANQASRVWLEDWGCAVGEMAPETLRALVDKAFAKRRPKQITVDVGLVGRIWSLQVIPITSAGYANVYGRDITERRRAEDALYESEEKYRNIVETAAEGIWAIDADRNPIYVNRRMADMLGYTVEEVMQRAWTDLVDPAEFAGSDARVSERKAGRRRKPQSYELALRRKDGSLLRALVNTTPQFDGAGKYIGAVSMLTNITERKRMEEALRESEARAASQAEYLRTLLDIAPAIVWIAGDRDCKRIVSNRAGEEFLRVEAGTNVSESGDEPQKVAHYRMFHQGVELVRPEELPFQRAARGELIIDYTFDFLFDDGEWRYTIGNITPLFDAEGQPSGAVGVFTDVTERRRAQEALRESQQRLSTIVDSIADGFYALDREWRFTHMNDAAERYFGIKSKAAMGRAIFDVFPAFRGSVFETEFRWAMESGEPTHLETPSVVTDRIVEIHAYPGLESITVIFRDVTERKKAQDELRLQANALQAAANGIVITDPNGTIQWVNGAFTRLTGYTFEEATGQNPRVLKSGQHDKPFYDKLWKTILAGRVWQGEITNKRKDGRLYTEEMTITPVRDDAGKTAHFIAIKQDVTERKRLEAELERTRTEFLGEVSHELKTPLTAIKGCAAMALSSPIPPDAAETRELFDIIDAQANRLTDLVANLLDVTRIEGRRLSIEPTVTDLAGIVEEARVIFEHSQYPHPLEVMLPRELPVLRADARRVVQVLTNLFTNAAKYSAPTTPIIVTAEKGEKEVTVHVRDAGVGIAAEKMPLLFRKFVQVQERGVKGTGLGLFICKGIVEAHGGRIWAESDGKGKGTVFSFTLPAVAGKTAPKHKGAAAGRGGVGRNAAERPFRIVAVDDEPDILHYIEHCLRSANCEVVSTSDPLAAAELVRFHAPDIVLLDMRMPGMSGLEVLEEIRKFCQTPVTFITATQNREDVVRGREFGGTTWLEKPFSPQQLLDHVGLVLARRRRR